MSKYFTTATITAALLSIVAGLGLWAHIALTDWKSENMGVSMSDSSTLTVRKHNECADMRAKGQRRRVSVYSLLLTAEIRMKEVDGKVEKCEHRFRGLVVTDWE